MSRNNTVGLAAALLGLAAILTGCNNGGGAGQSGTTGGGGTTPPAGGKTLQIAVIPKGTSHEYWIALHAGAVKAQQELQAKGTPINVIWKGTQSEGDRNGEVTIVETFITQHVDGMVLAPLDSQALVTPVHDAVSHQIPVVIIDSPLKGADFSSLVATDNEKGGELAAGQLGTLLNGKGKVLVLSYQQGSASTEARESGFLTGIKKFPGITVLSSNQYGGPSTDTAKSTSDNLLARYGSQVNGIFASNESNTLGMRLSLKDKGLLGKVKFVGFDADPELLTALKANEIQGLVVQNPLKMGYLGVMTLVDVLAKKTVPKSVDTGVAVITPQNVNQPDMQDLLSPPIDKYLK